MAALQDRQLRDKKKCTLFVNGMMDWCQDMGIQVTDTEELLNTEYDKGSRILLEGTQGTMLDFYLASWPYVTARQTHASAWLTESGLSPRLDNRVVMVLRTYPIRVAGNSGPLPGEINWSDLARDHITHGIDIVNLDDIVAFEEMEVTVRKEWHMPDRPLNLYTDIERETYSEKLVNIHKEVFTRLGEDVTSRLAKLFELTTVTKKLRRIASIDDTTTKRAIRINRPDIIFLNFLQYASPKDAGVIQWEKLTETAKNYIRNFEKAYGVPVGWVSTSATTVIKVPISHDGFIKTL
jgi:adenylosuccinate synthase